LRSSSAHARRESLVAPVALGKSAAGDIRLTQCEQVFDIWRANTLNEAAHAGLAEGWVGRVHVMADEMFGRSSQVVWKTEAFEHAARHLGADDLVAIEMRPLLGSRLANVVEQCC
jgi:hypothetical protein